MPKQVIDVAIGHRIDSMIEILFHPDYLFDEVREGGILVTKYTNFIGINVDREKEGLK